MIKKWYLCSAVMLMHTLGLQLFSGVFNKKAQTDTFNKNFNKKAQIEDGDFFKSDIFNYMRPKKGEWILKAEVDKRIYKVFCDFENVMESLNYTLDSNLYLPFFKNYLKDLVVSVNNFLKESSQYTRNEYLTRIVEFKLVFFKAMAVRLSDNFSNFVKRKDGHNAEKFKEVVNNCLPLRLAFLLAPVILLTFSDFDNVNDFEQVNIKERIKLEIIKRISVSEEVRQNAYSYSELEQSCLFFLECLSSINIDFRKVDVVREFLGNSLELKFYTKEEVHQFISTQSNIDKRSSVMSVDECKYYASSLGMLAAHFAPLELISHLEKKYLKRNDFKTSKKYRDLRITTAFVIIAGCLWAMVDLW